jgi:3-oxoacyl-[acyl-carrier-protein] synthase-3
MTKITAAITAVGKYVPDYVLTNKELETMVDTNDDWITTRTGIKERRILKGEGLGTSYMAVKAAQDLLKKSNTDPKDIDLVLVASATPDMPVAATAVYTATEIGAVNAFAYDINAACTGFTYGIDLASKYILADPSMKVLVIGSETLSTRVDWQDRNTCVLFGDGAGAAVLGSGENGRGIFGSKLRSDGRLWQLLHMDGPESQNKELQSDDWEGALIRMNGSEIFKYAVRAMQDVVNDLLQQNNLTIKDIDLVIPHQANIRILNKLKERLGLPDDKVFINLEKYGNTSAASIPIALNEANYQNCIKKNDIVLLCTFGAGLTWGSLLMRW